MKEVVPCRRSMYRPQWLLINGSFIEQESGMAGLYSFVVA